MLAGPPPLTPMSKDRTNMTTATTAENQPRGLGAALATLNSSSMGSHSGRGRHQAVSLEEHVESGLGQHHDDDEAISVPDIRKYTLSLTCRAP